MELIYESNWNEMYSARNWFLLEEPAPLRAKQVNRRDDKSLSGTTYFKLPTKAPKEIEKKNIQTGQTFPDM